MPQLEQLLGGDWAERLDRALAFVSNEQARGQIIARFEGQYLPAILQATTATASTRAWDALRSYMTAGATPRKPFALSYEEATAVAQALYALLSEALASRAGE